MFGFDPRRPFPRVPSSRTAAMKELWTPWQRNPVRLPEFASNGELPQRQPREGQQ
jgi:hypothetical protein